MSDLRGRGGSHADVLRLCPGPDRGPFSEAFGRKGICPGHRAGRNHRKDRPAGIPRGVVKARKPLPGTSTVLGAHLQGLETYILQPRDPADFDLLVETIRPKPSPLDIDVVIGVRGPIAPPELCNGLMVPMVVFDQIYSFDRDVLIKAIPRPENIAPEQFYPAAEEVFDRIMQMTDNAGATDEHRALNYLAMRFPGLYAKAAEEFARDFSLRGVEVRLSPLSGTRKIVDVIFSYTNRNTDFTEKFFVRMDVTEEFPFLVTKLSPYYDR